MYIEKKNEIQLVNNQNEMIYWLPFLKFRLVVLLSIISIVAKPLFFYMLNILGVYTSYLDGKMDIEGGKYTQLIYFLLFIIC